MVINGRAPYAGRQLPEVFLALSVFGEIFYFGQIFNVGYLRPYKGAVCHYGCVKNIVSHREVVMKLDFAAARAIQNSSSTNIFLHRPKSLQSLFSPD